MCKTGGARQVVQDDVPPKKKGREIIQDNKSTFGLRGQTVFIIFHNHSWLPFNAGLAIFMDRKLPMSKQ